MLSATDISPTQRYSIIRDIVLECENLGYNSFWLDDHLMYNDWPILECWTTLSALAANTSKIRLGTMVTCNIHRNPAMLAKSAATLDVISSGRLELGIGAGVQEREHTAYGFGFPKFSDRVERLSEALKVMKELWTLEKASFQGKHYALSDAVCEPKPIQKPHPPITVGGSSELLLRRVTAPYADRFDWGLQSIDEYKRKLKFLESQCKIIGRNFDQIEKSCWPAGQLLIAEKPKDLETEISRHKPENVSLEDFKKNTLAATPDECIEQLQVYINLGVTYFMLYFADFPSTNGLKLFAEKVASRIGG
jgi:F420-dependent oxidoreductase-like protein